VLVAAHSAVAVGHVADLTGQLRHIIAEGMASFLLTIAPPRIHGLTGTPVNPLAIF
jgi:hypothetical protein